MKCDNCDQAIDEQTADWIEVEVIHMHTNYVSHVSRYIYCDIDCRRSFNWWEPIREE